MSKAEHNNKLVLVTGGAGYKGSTLCRELLYEGYRVRVIDNLMYGGRSLTGLFNHPCFEFIKGDITNHKDINRVLEGVTDVIHLAAIVGDKPCERNPKRSIEVNYKGTQLLADATRKKNIDHFIFASTCSNYGIADTHTPATEERELNPMSLYAETKIDCEQYLSQLSTDDAHFQATSLRFSTGFGISGRTRFDLTVNSFAYEALKNKKLIVFAEEAWRPFTHVLDIAKIYCRFLEIPKEQFPGMIFNAGWNEQNYMKKDIVNIIKEVIENVEIDFINTIEDKRSYRVDFTKINEILQFKPLMSVKDGVTELVKAIQAGLLTDQDFESNRLK
ncbi:MAG: NAD-dependent epimerase/dehydratase family protein [bacterium]